MQTELKTRFKFFSAELLKEIETFGIVKTFEEDIEIVKSGQYIKLIPIVLSGAVKVLGSYEEKELLLYYILPNESCIMSYQAVLKDSKSRFVAITEKKSTLLLLPADKILIWLKQFPELNTLFIEFYNIRYNDLLNTINNLIFEKLDERLLSYLKEKSRLDNTKFLDLRHQNIANELGTAREVVSRTLKKLESEQKIKFNGRIIEIL